MRRLLLSTYVMLLFLTVQAEAQVSKYRGSFDVVSGYTSGFPAGLFGYGIATVSRTGVVLSTLYWPYDNLSASGGGLIDRRGRFRFVDGTTGGAQLFSNRFGYGTFGDNAGGGIFVLSRR